MSTNEKRYPATNPPRDQTLIGITPDLVRRVIGTLTNFQDGRPHVAVLADELRKLIGGA